MKVDGDIWVKVVVVCGGGVNQYLWESTVDLHLTMQIM